MSSDRPTHEIHPELLELLACPACRVGVTQEGDRLVCGDCGRRYPIDDGIPVMLLEEAEGGPDAGSGGAPETKSEAEAS